MKRTVLGWVATLRGGLGVLGSVPSIQQHLGGRPLTILDAFEYVFITALFMVGFYTLLRGGRSESNSTLNPNSYVAHCTSCGAEVQPAARFCGGCGQF